MSDTPIIQALQTIHEQVQQAIRAELGEEWFVTHIGQQTSTSYLLTAKTLVSPIEAIQRDIYANYTVECQDSLWQRKRVRLTITLNGNLRIQEITEIRRSC